MSSRWRYVGWALAAVSVIAALSAFGRWVEALVSGGACTALGAAEVRRAWLDRADARRIKRLDADAEGVAQAEQAAAHAKSQGGSWSGRDGMNLPIILLLFGVACGGVRSASAQVGEPSAVVASSAWLELPRCVAQDDYPYGPPSDAYHAWRDDDGAFWCMCYYGDYDVIRLPEGCSLDRPVLGYTVDAHKDVMGRLAGGKVLLAASAEALALSRAETDGEHALLGRALDDITARKLELREKDTQMRGLKRRLAYQTTWQMVGVVAGVVLVGVAAREMVR